MTAPDLVPTMSNIEGRDDFNVEWPWFKEALSPGLTAVLRVKNEARSLPWVLPPVFAATQHVVLVDNQSDDGTPDVARKVASDHGCSERLTVKEYPFDVSRCGPEHLATPARSVHSLAYFYNWAFSHVRTTYSMKWDGDMVLTPDGVATYADLSWQLQAVEVVATMPRHPLFVESDQVAYLDLGMRNVESYVYPNRPGYSHAKGFDWEVRLTPEGMRPLRLPPGLCVELKYLDSDEFAHWTSTEAFADNARAGRKQREWQVFSALTQRGWESLSGVHRIESPPGTHVIDYTTREWLPRAKRPLGEIA